MSRIKNIACLLKEMKKIDSLYNSKIQIHWRETDRLYRNSRCIEHFTKLHFLYVNEISCRALIHQSMEKELRNGYLDKGETHE